MTEAARISRRTVLAGATALGLWLPGSRIAGALPGPTGSTWNPSGWSFVPSLSDDFTHPGSSRRWHRGLWYPVSGVGTFTDDNVSFRGGQLHLTATTGEPGGPPYRFGAVESYFDLPGVCSYVEVRARVLDSRARVLSAIWQQSSNHDNVDHLLAGADPHPEIDVEETFLYNFTYTALHTWGAAGHVAYPLNIHNAGVADISQGFHTYGFERLDGRLRFYFDRQLTWELVAPHPSLARMSRHQVLSLEGHLGAPNPAFLPASFDVDHVHTYYRTAGPRARSGWYHLVNAATGELLTPSSDGRPRCARPGRGRRDAVWLVRETSDHTYVVVSPRRHQMLTLEGGMGQPGVPVTTERARLTGAGSDGSRRRWHVLSGPDGTFHLRSKFSGLSIDAADGTLRQQESTDAASQRWLLRPLR